MAAIPPQLIGESPEFHALSEWISDIASLDLPVLVLGEAGTGKEMIASRLHFLSPRWEQAYYAINCAAYTEAELQTYIYGDDTRTGLLDLADSGTLFFDNIEGLSNNMLERLARLVEYGDFRPADGQYSQTVNIRYIFSADPSVLARSDRRGELSAFLDRLSSDVVNIPPLRDRKSDIVPLLMHFGRKTASKLGADQFPGLTSEAIEQLMDYDWPGNMRELKHVIERSTARAYLQDESMTNPLQNVIFNPFVRAFRQTTTEVTELPSQPVLEAKDEIPRDKDFNDRVLRFERGLIDEALTVNNHHQGKAADYLGLTYHAFRGLLRKHGLKK